MKGNDSGRHSGIENGSGSIPSSGADGLPKRFLDDRGSNRCRQLAPQADGCLLRIDGPRSLRRGALLLLFSLLISIRSVAAPSWDGTWAGGWQNGDGIQIIIAGDKVIWVYRDDDYPEILSSAASPEGSMLCVWWVGGDGFLQRTGDGEATISLRERGRPVRLFVVKRE
jgi:hypothetical protein